MIRVLICGSRYWNRYGLVVRELRAIVDAGEQIECVIHGDCRGADHIGAAAAINLGIDVTAFPANWVKHGVSAGPRRNSRMLKEGRPDLVLAFHRNIARSKGTRDMIDKARRAGVRVKIIKD
jgi:imidazolonepropionase-like amidohydrolase